MIKTRKGKTRINAKDKDELFNDLVQILISVIEEPEMLSLEEVEGCFECAKSLKRLYNGEPQLAPEYKKIIEKLEEQITKLSRDKYGE